MLYYYSHIAHIPAFIIRCLSSSANLEDDGEPRFRELTETLLHYFDDDRLWETFGIDAGVVVSLEHVVLHCNGLRLYV